MHFFKKLLRGKLLAPNLKNFAEKLLSQPWHNYSNIIYEIQLHIQRGIDAALTHAALTQPWRSLDAALMQP